MSASARGGDEFYVLGAAIDAEGRRRRLLDPPPVPGVRSWLSGRVIPSSAVGPIALSWDPDTLDALVSDHEPVGIPLMSQALLSVLRLAGVDHLQDFPVELRGEHPGEVDRSFRAVNVVGVPACVEDPRGARVRLGELDPPVYWHDGFSVDAAKTMGLRLFRPAEIRSAIVVHGSIRRAIESAGLAVRCTPTRQWCG